MSFDKDEARNRFLGKLHENRGPADVFDRAQVRRVPVHADDLLVPRVPAPNTASRKLPKSRKSPISNSQGCGSSEGSAFPGGVAPFPTADRKSTRLNSSH